MPELPDIALGFCVLQALESAFQIGGAATHAGAPTRTTATVRIERFIPKLLYLLTCTKVRLSSSQFCAHLAWMQALQRHWGGRPAPRKENAGEPRPLGTAAPRLKKSARFPG